MKKSDIARAWKDESYRQTLSDEQLNSLPAHPAGELEETELASVYGGGGQDVGGFGAGAASASSSAFSRRERCCSFALVCPINIFSVDKVKVIDVDDLLDIANQETEVCVHRGC